MSAVIVLCLLSFSLAGVLCAPQPKYQFWTTTKFNGRYYKYVATAMNWADAELYCVSAGGNLVSIHSEREFNFIDNFIRRFDPEHHHTYIGLTDAAIEGKWMWSDGTKMDFTRWMAGQPNNHGGKEHCGHTNYGRVRRWNDVPCNGCRKFVCASRVI